MLNPRGLVALRGVSDATLNQVHVETAADALAHRFIDGAQVFEQVAQDLLLLAHARDFVWLLCQGADYRVFGPRGDDWIIQAST